MKDSSLILDNDEISFCIYGLGKTGNSVVKYFTRKGFTKYKAWDDNKKKGKKAFSQYLDLAKYIVLSPGIRIEKTKFKKKLKQNKHKIISDLDLFYLLNPKLELLLSLALMENQQYAK